MAATSLPHLLLFLCSASVVVILRPVSSADAPILAVRGGSVQLNVQTSLEGMDIEYIFWRFNLTHSVLRYSNESKNPLKVYQEYEGRVDLNPKTYTLVLNNLQDTDNGIYSAKITDHRGYEKDVAKHELHIHEAVPDLEFTMLLLYFNSSEGYCNVSVTCTAGDSYVAYTCDPDGCTQEMAVLVTPRLLLGITGTDGTVVCNASNLVSAKSRWGRMRDVCTEEMIYSSMSLLGPAVIVVDVFTALSLLYLLLYCLLIRPKHTGVFFTTQKLKMKCASVELLHVNEFEEVLKDPSLPDYLRGAAIYSISRGRRPPLPRLGDPFPDHEDTYTLFPQSLRRTHSFESDVLEQGNI